jgi:hypothetical protein
MLIMGVCNPADEDDSYNGLYMTATELSAIVRDNKMRNLPVKTEDAGSEVGRVVTSFLDARGNLNCMMQLSAASVPVSRLLVCTGTMDSTFPPSWALLNVMVQALPDV